MPQGETTWRDFLAPEAEQHESWNCVHYDDARQFLECPDSPKDFMCIHSETLPQCPISASPIIQPVLAADGKVYEKKELEWYLQQGQKPSPTCFGVTLSSDTSVKIRIASKQAIKCKSNPEKAVTNNTACVVVCRASDNPDQAIIIIETLSGAPYSYGKIDAYALRQVEDTARVEIQHQVIEGLQYSQMMAESLFATLHIDLLKITDKTHIIEQEKLDAILLAIHHDERKASNGEIRYSALSGKPLINITEFFTRAKYHNSADWPRDIMLRASIWGQFTEYGPSLKNTLKSSLVGNRIQYVLPEARNQQEQQSASRPAC